MSSVKGEVPEGQVSLHMVISSGNMLGENGLNE